MDTTLSESDSAVGVDRSEGVDRPAALSSDLRVAHGIELESDLRTEVTRLLVDDDLTAIFRDQLDDPGLVLSTGYIGHDRRRSGLFGRLSRSTFEARRALLRVEVALVVLVVVAGTVGVLLLASGGLGSTKALRTPTDQPLASHSSDGRGATTPAATTPARALTSPARTPSTTVHVAKSPAVITAAPPVSTSNTPVQSTTPPAAPSTTSPPATTPATTPAAPAAANGSAAPTDLTPDQMGAEALTLVRYPWQNIPGYSIQFQPIADAPSPGFYGNTTFTWGQAGGTSVLYVYPGETIDQLAGIIAFEIGHEVDAAAVQPQGGETDIENILGIHPASWAPDCDCAEQGFLSGWYASAFSNYWSPGVGNWSDIAPEPTGSVLAAVEPWFNPTIS
jgi:hypothetical protein